MPVLGPTASTVGGPNRLVSTLRPSTSSRRASPAPTQRCGPQPKVTWAWASGRSSDEGVGVLEAVRVAVGGLEGQEEAPALGHVEVVALEGLLGSPGHAGDDPAVAEDLLHRVGDQLRVGGEPLPVVGVLGEQLHGGGELPAGGLGAGEHEAGDHADDVVLGQAVPVDLGLDRRVTRSSPGSARLAAIRSRP